jgi:ribosomal protein S18 acetylase RimI-like enzyme
MIRIRTAQLEDTEAMGHCMVDTFLVAHRDHMPAEAWQRRHDEWTYEVSAAGWTRTIKELSENANPDECIYLAVDGEDHSVVGLAMGCPAQTDELANAGEVCALYVRQAYQHRGLGRRLLQAVARDLAQMGKRALLIRVLATNTPARHFYEAMGGRLVGECNFEEYGYILPEAIYGWSELGTLTGDDTGHAT